MNAQQAAQVVVSQRASSTAAAAAAAAYPPNEGSGRRGQLDYGSYPSVNGIQHHHHHPLSMSDDPSTSKSSLAFSMMNDGESYLSF